MTKLPAIKKFIEYLSNISQKVIEHLPDRLSLKLMTALTGLILV
jgi:hypothetical protein